jgi:hypothetical protein
MKPVRRLVVVALALLAFAGTATAGLMTASGDGTLSVRSADGTVWMKVNGAVVGRFDQGVLRVVDPADGEDLNYTVWGAERRRPLTDTVTLYAGADVRFRIVGRFRIRINNAVGISLSAAGQGIVGLEGDSGTYSFNGDPQKPMPFDPDGNLTPFPLNDGSGPAPGP